MDALINIILLITFVLTGIIVVILSLIYTISLLSRAIIKPRPSISPPKNPTIREDQPTHNDENKDNKE